MYQVCEYKKASAGESLRRQKKRNGIVNLFWIFSLISIMLCFSVYLRFFSASLHSLILQIDHYLLHPNSANLLKNFSQLNLN